ncbi:hypothetical protein HDU93_000468, partial [Gonapodya sp. JEL0774]
LNKSVCLALLMTIDISIRDRMDTGVKDGTAMELWKSMEKTYMVVTVAAEQNTIKEWQGVSATGKTTD